MRTDLPFLFLSLLLLFFSFRVSASVFRNEKKKNCIVLGSDGGSRTIYSLSFLLFFSLLLLLLCVDLLLSFMLLLLALVILSYFRNQSSSLIVAYGLYSFTPDITGRSCATRETHIYIYIYLFIYWDSSLSLKSHSIQKKKTFEKYEEHGRFRDCVDPLPLLDVGTTVICFV